MRKPTKAITTAYSKLIEITTENDLKREGLTLSDYSAALDLMQFLRTPGSTSYTYIKSVAEFFKRCGYNVTLDAVNYKITC